MRFKNNLWKSIKIFYVGTTSGNILTYINELSAILDKVFNLINYVNYESHSNKTIKIFAAISLQFTIV